MKKDTRDLLKGIGFFTIIGLGATVAQKVYDWTRTPNSAYVIDANGDNRKDRDKYLFKSIKWLLKMSYI